MSEYPTYLIHYGIQGQKWGHRRWQNEDGSLTPEGREHYGYGSEKDNRKLFKQIKRVGKNTKTNEWGTHKKLSFKTYEKLSKNKAVQEAINDESLRKAASKFFNTDKKYFAPDADEIMARIGKKINFDYENASDEEWESFRLKVDKQYNKEYAKFKELSKKDPSTIAMKELDKEISRVADTLAAKYSNVKIGDITYNKHLIDLLDQAVIQKYMNSTYDKKGGKHK